jgi:hypothetical protein
VQAGDGGVIQNYPDEAEIIATITLAKRGTQFCSSIWNVIDDIEIPSSKRAISAGRRYFLSIEHLAGVFALFECQVFASAFALLRPLTEAFVGGAWLHHSATDTQVANFDRKGKKPTIRAMISAVEQTDIFANGTLSRAHEANWKMLCGLTHGGPEADQLCYSEGAIGRVLPERHGQDALNYAASVGMLSAMGIAVLANSNDAANKLLMIGKAGIPL